MPIFLFTLTLYIFNTQTWALNFHQIGFINTILPGGGQFFQKNYKEGSLEFALEVSTFSLGYHMAKNDSITLDGTPMGFPTIGNYRLLSKARTSRKQIQINIKKADYSKELTAAVLQEFGMKYHFYNTFYSYREKFHRDNQTDAGQGFDERSASQMLLDPFRIETLSSPWVYGPLAISAAVLYFDYQSQIKSISQNITPLKRWSRIYLGFDQMAMYPVGSAMPEETFYRGYVQNEFYYLYRSPYFSIPMSSLIFALSHEPESYGPAFLSGLYQGMLVHKNHGNLAEANTLHFWAVLFLGVETFLLTLKSQAPAGISYTTSF